MSAETPFRPSRAALAHCLMSGFLAALTCFSGGLAARGIIRTPAAAIRPAPARDVAIPASAGVDVTPQLYRRLAGGGRGDFAIEFRERADLSGAPGMAWQPRGRYVHDRLRETAERSQAGVKRMLEARGASFDTHWIKNTIIVHGGDLATLRTASAFGEVRSIRELPHAKVISPTPSRNHSAPAGSEGVADNIHWIGADQVWEQGTTGSGVTVGVIDTGVLVTHEALRQQYRGYHDGGFDHDYNWFDPFLHVPEPTSMDPHGTHVLGTIVGDDHANDPALRNRIGVAPGSKWISCLGFPDGGDFDSALLGCGEFMLAPTRTDGSAADPDRRPQVVNNSWSERTCDGNATSFYADMVEAWAAAGIFPVFAVGNAPNCGLPEPPGLSTVSSPAALGTTFAVGSTGNHNGEYATHSLWGPTSDPSPGLPVYPDPRGYPQLKPQVVAPGVDIRSALDFGDNVYDVMTGTSMSAAHITGLVALMLEAGDCLTGDYATLGTLIMQNARPIDYDSGGNPPPGVGNLPNYATGWGEIDAPAAVNAAAHACGPQGFVRGHVSAASGAPLAGAKVEIFADEAVRVYQRVTDSAGNYIQRVPANTDGGYTVRVSAYGYLPDSESGVLVREDATTLHDVSLAVAPSYKINGRVVDAATGWPLHAKVQVTGYPGEPIWTDPVTGAYSLRLAEGTAYRFDVSSDVPGYQPTSREIASVAGGGTQDFALAADPVRCEAPGYTFAATLLGEGFEDTVGAPPNGWTISSAGLGWLFGSAGDLSGSIVVFPDHGRFAAANDELGANGGYDNDARFDFLTLPAINLAGSSAPVLRYRSFLPEQLGSGHVEASTDGGATWTGLGVPRVTSSVEGWTQEAVSLASVTVANVKLRFHFDDGSTDEAGSFGGGWAVDDVSVADTCVAPTTGGLIVGHVRDANTGAGLNGADVRVDGGDAVVSAASADAGFGDGSFVAYAPGGTTTIRASGGTLPLGYGDALASVAVTDGSTILQDVALPAGRLRLYPAPEATVELGTTASTTFTVTNSGTLPLAFGFEGAAVEEHFEGAEFPPPGWNVVNHGTGCTWTRSDPFSNTAGGDGFSATMDLGIDCGSPDPVDTSLITPPIDLGASQTASMGFFLSFFEGFGSDARLDVDISIDDGTSWTTVFTQIRDNNPFGPGALVEIDLTAFAGASAARARFHFSGIPPFGAAQVDQVHLFNGISANPLLDVAPESGTLAVGENRDISAVFDASGVAQPGVYTVPLRVAENTPYEFPFGDVVATMTVTAPASYGSIAGTVQSLGACDSHPVSLSGATIRIEANAGGSYTTTSAADGSYRYWLPAVQGPFAVTVEADGHLALTQTLAVEAGAETSADFGLRPLLPCLATDPSTLQGNVAAGGTSQRTFDLLNLGAAGTDWTLRVGGDPAELSPVALAQTNSPTPADDVSVVCGNPETGFVLENRYFRVFTASSETVVRGITFAIESAQSSAGAQPITLRLHSLDGDLTLEHLTLLHEQTTTVANVELQRQSVVFDSPVTVAAGTTIVAELYVPPGTEDGNAFFPGANSEGESAPAYWAARDCGLSEPLSFPDIGFFNLNLILEIDTLASAPCGDTATPVDWLALSPVGGTLGADATTPVLATFNAGARAAGKYRGTMCLAPGSAATPEIVPVELFVGDGADSIFADGFDR